MHKARFGMIFGAAYSNLSALSFAHGFKPFRAIFKKLKFLSNLVLRTNSLFKNFKKNIDIKNVFYIEADYIWGRKHKLFGWRSKIKDYSLILGAAIHMIDLVLWITNLKPISVYTIGSDKITNKN